MKIELAESQLFWEIGEEIQIGKAYSYMGRIYTYLKNPEEEIKG